MEKEKNHENIYEKLNNYGLTKKTLYSFVSIIVCVLLIIVLSIVQAEFDISKLNNINFWINFVVLCGISIYGMSAGLKIGDDVSRNNDNGMFRKSLKKYSLIFKTIDDKKYFAYFEDWLEILRMKKLRKKIEDILRDNGIYQLEVLDLDRTEITKLLQPYKKDWKGTLHEDKYEKETFFMSYTQQQIDIILAIMNGEVKMSKLPKSFFVSVFNQSDKDMWESASKSEKKKGYFLSLSYVHLNF